MKRKKPIIKPAAQPSPEDAALREARMESIREFFKEGKPAKFFKEFNTQDLIDAGIPKEDLAKMGIIKAGGKADGVDYYQPVTLRECARLFSDVYGEFIDPMRISRAFKKGAIGRRDNGSIIPAQLMKWWDEHERMDKGTQSNLFSAAQKAELERKIDEARKARMEADEIERANSDKWMLVEYHNASMQRAGGVAWGRFCAIIEKDLLAGLDAKLKATATPEIHVEVMNDARQRHLAAVDILQKEMEKLGQ